jgi:H+/gluconate symporter-like permease
MVSAASFLAQFFPLFLLGALFGKLMEDSGSVTAIASLMTRRLGPQRAVLAVVLAGALVTYGGVSLFVAFFVNWHRWRRSCFVWPTSRGV